MAMLNYQMVPILKHPAIFWVPPVVETSTLKAMGLLLDTIY